MPGLSGVSHFQCGDISVWWTSKATGSFALNEPNLPDRYRALTGGSDVVFPRQVHGAAVFDATVFDTTVPIVTARWAPSATDATVATVPAAGERSEADAVISIAGGPAIAVITADCAPVAVWTADGVVGVAHAGWRGLVAGVIEATVEAVRDRSGDPHSVWAALGPCIGPCCYEFGVDELALVSNVYGDSVRCLTNNGKLALDMRAGVLAALERSGAEFVRHLGVPEDSNRPSCTACGSGWFSWRRHQDSGRQALVVQSQRGKMPSQRGTVSSQRGGVR